MRPQFTPHECRRRLCVDLSSGDEIAKKGVWQLDSIVHRLHQFVDTTVRISMMPRIDDQVRLKAQDLALQHQNLTNRFITRYGKIEELKGSSRCRVLSIQSIFDQVFKRSGRIDAEPHSL